MLDTLIQSKTRLKLLLRFFLNPESSAYLRGLAQEFDESTNSVRVELNRFEEAGLIAGYKEGNKKVYKVNTKFPMFGELQKIAFKHFGIDQIIEQVVQKLGDVNAVYLTGDLAHGLNTSIVDVTIIGNKIDSTYLATLVEKAENLIDRKIRTLVYNTEDDFEVEEPRLLIFGEEIEFGTTKR
ncbi:winged helix-turn-helix domain-containing protein [Gracilimonas sp.]|uniref:winged helix-turn-helix domain-containing protein n=1 Tax=Gracilimonas sp. TaxID=1974203 RepID=UPI003BAA5EFB